MGRTATRCTSAHCSIYLALLPSGPDAVRRLRLHRVRAAVRPTQKVSVSLDGLSSGQRHDERAAMSFDRLHLDASSHGAHAIVHNRQAQADPADVQVIGMVRMGPGEPFEDSAERGVGNADTVVTHFECDDIIVADGADDLDKALSLVRI